ncbi:alpha/beta hydrolase [Gordonia pseudamarae]|uniref:Alpha/beta hydrolase n=1 Tax=Gordonia pseudamarae TaxID=2831662 RepID=A0ABX6IQL7_9ACTN|nr:alpha/beta hydrolase [Gordonia sp. (in: high G+C Gram-positive bacteria)]QHN28602.1 alpha/beta hydrolase [Gordonia pseudamarae]QHN37476.1 alpha/beta hydrolase [Gordonia pseudamarae]
MVGLPGTGSDADYVQRAFGPAATRLGLELIASQPADDLVAGHLAVLDEAARNHRSILVGGVSIGAALAVRWALTRELSAPDPTVGRCAGILAALPPWSGDDRHAPARASATATADSIRDLGLEATISAMRASSPAWLADELARSWAFFGDRLESQLRQAAAFVSPRTDEIARLRTPLAITASLDDPIHPLLVARAWCEAAPRAAVTELPLAEWGTDPALLGDTTARTWTALL